MPEYSSHALRNVALVGHGSVGKTMLAEAMLHKAGAVGAMGELARGTTVSDFDDQEKEHQHSLQSSLMSFVHEDCHVNLIDTPGYLDFFGEVMCGVRVADGGVAIVDAVSGVQVGTERAWAAADARDLSRIIFISMMDRENADFEKTFQDIRDTLSPAAIPVVSKARL